MFWNAEVEYYFIVEMTIILEGDSGMLYF